MNNLTSAEKSKLIDISNKLKINPNLLWAVIQFESGWDPNSKNVNSSARGLLQFINARARDLGYTSSLDLVRKNPTRLNQLDVIYKDLRKYAPFPNAQSILMAIFYPRYRKVHPSTVFPKNVQDANPNIVTVQDYLDYVGRRVKIDYINKDSIFMIILAGLGLYVLGRRKR